MLRVVSMLLVLGGIVGFGMGAGGAGSGIPGTYQLTNITYLAAALLIGVGMLVWVLTDIRDALNKPESDSTAVRGG